MTTTPVIDTTLAIEQAGGNEELAKELFGMLLAELPALREKLVLAVENNQLDAMWDHAHKIHGSTAYCGVPALRESIRELENLIKAGDMDAISRQLPAVKSCIEQVLSSGQAYLGQSWKKD